MDELNSWERGPKRKQRIRKARDDRLELEFISNRRAASDRRLENAFDSIFEKYSRDFSGVSDEIDLRTGKIVVDNRHVSRLNDDTTGKWGFQSNNRLARALISSESGTDEDEARAHDSDGGEYQAHSDDSNDRPNRAHPRRSNGRSGHARHRDSNGTEMLTRPRRLTLVPTPKRFTIAERKLYVLLLAQGLEAEEMVEYFPGRNKMKLYMWYKNTAKTNPILLQSLETAAHKVLNGDEEVKARIESLAESLRSSTDEEGASKWSADEDERLCRFRSAKIEQEAAAPHFWNRTADSLRLRIIHISKYKSDLLRQYCEEVEQDAEAAALRLSDDFFHPQSPERQKDMNDTDVQLLAALQDKKVPLSHLTFIFNCDPEVVDEQRDRSVASATPSTTAEVVQAKEAPREYRGKRQSLKRKRSEPAIPQPGEDLVNREEPLLRGSRTPSPLFVPLDEEQPPASTMDTIDSVQLPKLQSDQNQRTPKKSRAVRDLDSAATVQDTEHETSLSALPSSLDSNARNRIESSPRSRLSIIAESQRSWPSPPGRLSTSIYPRFTKKPEEAGGRRSKRDAPRPDEEQRPEDAVNEDEETATPRASQLITAESIVPDHILIPAPTSTPDLDTPRRRKRKKKGMLFSRPSGSRLSAVMSSSALQSTPLQREGRVIDASKSTPPRKRGLISSATPPNSAEAIGQPRSHSPTPTPGYLKPRVFKNNGRPRRQLFSSSLDSVTARKLLGRTL